ncbi:MAG: hypothetical protein IJ598_09395 [Ruminococcus sp.]|nr:hypothetical protein [Ruminococcus sp.]
MTYDEFLHQLENLNEDTDAIDIYTSPDFQCDQTGGFPTSLCVNWDKGKAWLQLNDNVNADGVDAAKYEQFCADYGIRDCPDIERFNQILSSLGDDARLTASLPEDGENYTFTM